MRVRTDDGGPTLVLRGRIDEHAALRPVAAQLTGDVTIDLRDVSFINSMGLREWIGLLQALHAAGCRVRLTRVSEFMVAQMNMVLDARGDASLDSFYAPYACEHCDREESVCVTAAAARAALAENATPAASCPACSQPMEYDGIPERDLAFLSETDR